MFYTIYKTTNLINGKIYIGKHQTKDINDFYMGSGKHLRHSIQKYGIENFKKEILFQFDNEEEMNAKEAELVTEEFCLREDTYNLCVGGQGGFSHINRDKEFMFQKNSKGGIKGSKTTNELRRFKLATDQQYRDFYRQATTNSVIKAKIQSDINNPDGQFAGKKHTEEAKRKIGIKNSENQIGSKNSQYGTIWITDGTVNTKIKKEDDIPVGWTKGRLKYKKG